MPDHDRPPTVAVVTLGCGRNEVDSENVVGLLSASGFRMVADPERADAVVVNTCAFVEAAKRESIDAILAAADLKERGGASAVFVTGCLAERYTRELREELPEADAIVPFADYSRLPELLRSRLANGSSPPLAPADSLPPSFLPAERPSPSLKRAGAEPRVVPPDASPLASPGGIPPPLVPAGRRSLPLVFPAPAGERFPARPLPRAPVALVKLAEGEALIHLLRDLGGIDGLRRVRLNYLQPDEITPGLLEEMAANPVVCSYFDLSLQHVSEPVLRRMRRGGSSAAFLRLIERVRSLDPDAAFRSNFILGFPGERQADVRQLEEFLEAARLDWVAFFPYSAEDGTAALDLDRRVASRTARARVEWVQELQDRVLAEVQAAWIGRRLEVLVERVDDAGTAEGRSFREGADSDGVVRIEQVAARPGDYLEVEVIAAEGPELLARRITV